MFAILFIIIFISALILVHEWGHFYAARRLGVRVDEFGFGFPPRLFSMVRKGVRYSFNALPFGGFVKIFGEHGEGGGNTESFISRPARHRFIILAAGVFMNFFLAWVLFSVASGIGVPTAGGEEAGVVPVSVIGVLPDSPAEQAGIKIGDQIIEARGQDVSLRIEDEEDVRTFADAYRGEEVRLIVRRQGEIREIVLTPRSISPEGEGPLGIILGRLMIERTPWYRAPIAGLESLAYSTAAIVMGLFDLVKTLAIEGRPPPGISGPIGIIRFAGDSQALGIAYFLQFVGVLSVNLAVLNFLPIPALDGGRIFFLLIEKIKGTPISQRVEQAAHTAGFIVLVLLMLIITYKDLAHIL